VEGEFEILPPQAGRVLSNIEFVWAEDSSSSASPFSRSGHRVLPNPERLFGLFASHLRVLYVARGREGDERPWHAESRILDAHGHVVAERDTSGAASSWWRAGTSVDLSQQPAGGYELEVKVWQEGDSDTLVQRAHWSLAWQADSWFRNPGDMEDLVHFLLTAEGEEAFVRMHPGEQESYLEAFWRERDPTPNTPRNEAREEFLRRVETANRSYASNGSVAGMFSDMGRVYIRYGEPGEILRQVVPAGDNTLRAMIMELSMTEDRPLGEVHQKGLGGDMRPYEVWIYEGEIPLPPDADPHLERNTRRKRLVFLFVDEQGTGDYRLRYSTE
jgi:GWxTD domain-containing protein